METDYLSRKHRPNLFKIVVSGLLRITCMFEKMYLNGEKYLYFTFFVLISLSSSFYLLLFIWITINRRLVTKIYEKENKVQEKEAED